jgi:hypothetical protein
VRRRWLAQQLGLTVKQFDKRVLRLVDLGYVQKRSVEKEGRLIWHLPFAMTMMRGTKGGGVPNEPIKPPPQVPPSATEAVDKYSGGDEGKKPPEEAVALIAPTWLSDGQRRAVVAKLNHGLSASEAQELLDELDWAKRRLGPALRSPAALLEFWLRQKGKGEFVPEGAERMRAAPEAGGPRSAWSKSASAASGNATSSPSARRSA